MQSYNPDIEDSAFSVLPPKLRMRIDRSMDVAISEASPNHHASFPRKRRNLGVVKTASQPIEPGGFVVENVSASGGFFVDDEVESAIVDSMSVSDTDGDDGSDRPCHAIPFRLIPRALQLLDLQPDDEDVLEVFRNAASGWENTSVRTIEGHTDDNLIVNRRDWRAVCAALMDTSGEGDDEAVAIDADEATISTREDDESDLSAEEYVDSTSENASEDSSGDDYQAGGFIPSNSAPKAKGRGQRTSTSRLGKSRSRKASSSPISSDDDGEKLKNITPRQKAECRRTFALFFPDTSESELPNKRIMIRDVGRVAELLKEKITTEEIVEMLEAFSTSPDKSMNLADFERMMVTTRMA